MYYFHFHTPENLFDEPLQCFQCRHVSENGHQCRNRVCIGLFLCHVHSKKIYHLRKGPSQVPGAGTGLFAHDSAKSANEIVFARDQFICEYNGEHIDRDELLDRYEQYTAPYAVQINRHRYSDGALMRGIGSLINTTRGTNFRTNCRLSIGRDGVKIRATQPIRNGQELFMSYGPAYRMNERGAESSTNRSHWRV
jgi:hypothetical protein